MAITVIDAPCGAGKTSWAIQEMQKNLDRPYIFVTPFLKEIDRIQEETCAVRTFRKPQHRNGGRKIDDFNNYLANGDSIATTHSTFANATDETLELLRDGDYCLILDEVLDVLVDYNKLQEGKRQRITDKDIELLQREGFISVDEYERVHWINVSSYPGSAYGDVERLARRGNLVLLDEYLLAWELPPEIFRCFSEVYVLTYLFEGSYLAPYFKYHQIPYEKASVIHNGEAYELIPYQSDAPLRAQYKTLLHIHEKPGTYRNTQLSATGFERLFRINKDTAFAKQMRNDLYNYFHNICKAHANDILWTCPKDYRHRLKGRGYTEFTVCEETADGQQEREKHECFLSLNARATNAYRDRHTLAYVYNMSPNPSFDKFFAKKEDGEGEAIKINRDLFSVSCLIQWVWRSAIRDGEEVNLYLPAPRMQKLLKQWLDGEI